MAPSPLSSANTPQMPAAQDGGGGGGGGPQSGSAGAGSEEQQYLEKVRQLSRYIEPLREMISRIGNEDQTKLDKMKKLMDILSNPTKRMPMETLLKCEKVLGRMNFNVDAAGGGGGGDAGKEEAPAPTATSSSTVNPLLEAVINLMNKQPASSELNHALHKSFGAPLDTIYGSDITLPPLPGTRTGRKRARMEEEEDEEEGNMRLILDREIAMLEAQYHVQDAGYGEEEEEEAEGDYSRCGGKRRRRRQQSATLVCSLEDCDLPSVPPVTVSIPASYPDDPPRLAGDSACEYETTPFLRRVMEALEARLAKMSRLFTLSQLLSAWETSVRAASSPRQRPVAVGRETVLLGL